MTGHNLIIRCSLCKSEQTIQLPDHTEDESRTFAALLDGTSDFYVKSPRDSDDSTIGRCVQCGGRIDCEVVKT